jgi:hypothetical protein
MRRRILKSSFYSRLCLERALGRDQWFLCEPLKYVSVALNRRIVVPPGLQTDFASIPRLLWRVLPKNGEYDGAAVLHDWGYRGNLSRCESDEVFFEAMLVLGVALWKARLMFLAVRLFGGRAYREGSRRD